MADSSQNGQRNLKPSNAYPADFTSANNYSEEDFAELVAENDQLRRIRADMERSAVNGDDSTSTSKISQLEEELVQKQHEARVQMLKARAAAQSRIRELEATISGMLCTGAREMENMKAINETLKLSREWTLIENAKLQEQVAHMRYAHSVYCCYGSKLIDFRLKLDALHGELDASFGTTQLFRSKLDDEKKKLDRFHAELSQQRGLSTQMSEEKALLQAEIERMAG